jgi:hypothetical protein
MFTLKAILLIMLSSLEPLSDTPPTATVVCRYYFLTLSDKVPEQFNEEKSKENSINEAHPSLLAINSTIAPHPLPGLHG